MRCLQVDAIPTAQMRAYFEFPQPQVTSLNPQNVPARGGATVTVRGTELLPRLPLYIGKGNDKLGPVYLQQVFLSGCCARLCARWMVFVMIHRIPQTMSSSKFLLERGLACPYFSTEQKSLVRTCNCRTSQHAALETCPEELTVQRCHASIMQVRQS